MKEKKLIFNFFVNRNWKKLTDSCKRAKILADHPIETLLQFSLFQVTADLQGIQLAPEESPNWKNQFPYPQKHSFLALQDLTTYLYLKIYFEFYKWKIWKKLTVNRQSYHPIETPVKDHVHTRESR